MVYKQGSRGDMVKQIQKALAAGGYKVIVDGIFGVITEEAVRNFQADKGLKVDGIVGVATMGKLFAAKLQSTLHLRKAKREIYEIIVHCTATPKGQERTVDQIRANHMAPVSKGGRGWSDIGYHYLVYLDGSIHEGRDVDTVGAHCLYHNAHSIGVCYVGGVSNIPNVAYSQLPAEDTRTPEQKVALLSLLKELKRLYPKATIHGHRDFANKACPSFDATKEYRGI